MPDWYREEWSEIPHYEKFPAGNPRGLNLGGKKGLHLARLLFEP